MSGTFSGINTALTGLHAQRQGLDLTGQNIANANTPGYSRQQLRMSAIGPGAVATLWATQDPAGGGVEVTDILRMRDEFLEARGREQVANGAFITGQVQTYDRIEQVIGEPSSTGLQSQMTDLWSAWHDLANRPGDNAARAQVLQRADTLADGLRDTHNAISQLWEANREQLDTVVAEVNSAASQVAELNRSIVRARQSDQPANELADRRDVLVERLAELTGGTALARSNGAVDVIMGGSSLVSGDLARELRPVGAHSLTGQAGDPAGLEWVDTGDPASASGGTVAANLLSLGTTLPDITDRLNEVTAALIDTVNDQHALGFDPTGAAGGVFFGGTDAASITVEITEPGEVAAADSATNPLDGTNADTIAELARSPDGADRLYRQFVVDLGVAAQSINRRAEIEEVIRANVDSARLDQSGVNLDEEMTNMLMYQRAYQAAAKVIDTIDSTLEYLVNTIGR